MLAERFIEACRDKTLEGMVPEGHKYPPHIVVEVYQYGRQQGREDMLRQLLDEARKPTKKTK